MLRNFFSGRANKRECLRGFVCVCPRVHRHTDYVYTCLVCAVCAYVYIRSSSARALFKLEASGQGGRPGLTFDWSLFYDGGLCVCVAYCHAACALC